MIYKDFKSAILSLLDQIEESLGGYDVAFEYNANNVAMIKKFNLLNNPKRIPDQDISIENCDGKLYLPDYCLIYLLQQKIEQNL